VTPFAAALAALVLAGTHPVDRSPSSPASLENCHTDVPGHIRIQDCRFAATVASALQRSPTLRQEVATVADLHGIVYVSTGVYALIKRRDLLGALSPQVGVSGQICVLRIALKKTDGDYAVATLAHELQHAIEVLEAPDARDEPSITALFSRIGSPVGEGLFETTAALVSEKAVLRELKQARAQKRDTPVNSASLDESRS
jgi:hypothetical protein